MAHTYVCNFIHCVFSTKRAPRVDPCRPAPSNSTLPGRHCTRRGLSLIAAGGTANHVICYLTCCALSLGPSCAETQRSSSGGWERIFMAGGIRSLRSVPRSEVGEGVHQNQEEHHRKRNLSKEFVALLRNLESCTMNGNVFGERCLRPSLRDSGRFLGAPTPR